MWDGLVGLPVVAVPSFCSLSPSFSVSGKDAGKSWVVGGGGGFMLLSRQSMVALHWVSMSRPDETVALYIEDGEGVIIISIGQYFQME